MTSLIIMYLLLENRPKVQNLIGIFNSSCMHHVVQTSHLDTNSSALMQIWERLECHLLHPLLDVYLSHPLIQ